MIGNLFVCRQMSLCKDSLTFAANCSIAMALSCPIFSTSCSFSRLNFSSRARFCEFFKNYNRDQWPLFYSGKARVNLLLAYSLDSRDAINSTGGQLQIDTQSWREIIFHCTCWPFVWQQICAISWDLFTQVQYNHQYILGWPPLRFTAKCPSEAYE